MEIIDKLSFSYRGLILIRINLAETQGSQVDGANPAKPTYLRPKKSVKLHDDVI